MYYEDRESLREYESAHLQGGEKRIEVRQRNAREVIRHQEKQYRYKLLIRKENFLLSSYLIALKQGHRQAPSSSRNR